MLITLNRKEKNMTVEKLEIKIKKLEEELYIANNKLFKITPTKPLIDDECKYDGNKKELTHKYTYFCGYCGESIRKNANRHKCGQIQNWSFN